jgi:hypothetical protein
LFDPPRYGHHVYLISSVEIRVERVCHTTNMMFRQTDGDFKMNSHQVSPWSRGDSKVRIFPSR